MKRKILVLMSALTFATTTGCNSAEISAASNAGVSAILLKDITGHWAKSSVETATQKGYVDGYEDQTFRPENKVSRAEFIKMVVRALNLPVKGDTSGSKWYVPFATAAATLGIYKGADFSLDEMNQPMTRMEMARVALRAADKDYQDPAAITNDPSMMYNATKLGLIQGLSGGQLGEDEVTTRAQSVTIIERILSVKDGGKLEVDRAAVGNAELVLKRTNIFTMMPEFFGGKQYSGEEWDVSKLTLETDDGLWKGSFDQIIAIDLANPNDPNKYLLGDMDDLHWYDLKSEKTSPLVKNGYMDSYVIYFKGHVDYNKDTEIYNDSAKEPGFDLNGFNSTARELVEHKLTGPASLFHKELGDIPAFIMSKLDVKLDNHLRVKMYAPARPPHSTYVHTLLGVMLPRK
ncbi:S-layer homology domain-containing protein [Paenibacillus roseipurpureus]|uniref:S-layer homology domain-containing protein n=1 Tax=Paenibacillus roseopurpureus TaxID=2918901 RepID=A0AA96RIT9_9BACL|nr:S-layer homology domain-containing protein [Paenibacillus sp. MBLB1832]WNR43160.1 S-layer homology domain-containing protein [Paenibacillus sp. MBLB1832]